MAKFLAITFFYNLIITIIVLSLFCMFETTEHWGTLGSLFMGTLMYSIIALVLLIPYTVIKYIFSDFMIIENTFMFFLLIIIMPIYEEMSYMLTDMWHFPYCSIIYPFIFWGIQCAIYILLRTYLKRYFKLISYFVILEDYLTTKKTKTLIVLFFLIIFIILGLKDYYTFGCCYE